jgi:hypothetical protein
MERAVEPGRAAAPALEHALHQYDSAGRGSRLSRQSRHRAPASRAWCAGTPPPWWCAPISTTPTSADTWPPTRRWRLCSKSASTTSSAALTPASTAPRSRRFRLLPGARVPRCLLARVPRRPSERKAPREFPPRTARPPRLSSYPHPWLMPDFWQFPTVSMGLGPISAIYQARFMKYLEHRGIIPASPRKVWAFLGDGECDEPEIAGRADAGFARETRQFDFRGQLQPAAPGRTGARQRQHHPGTGSRVSRRGLERDQGHLGLGLGRSSRARFHRPCCSSACTNAWTANTRPSAP